MITPTKLRTGDEVIVVAGKDLGKKGTLRKIIKSKNKGIVTKTLTSSCFNFEYGTSTSTLPRIKPLRILVKQSAIGSWKLILLPTWFN